MTDEPKGPDEGDGPKKPRPADGAARKQRGRPFPRGVSGNPSGKPKGRRNNVTVALDLLAEGRAERIVEALLARAEAGDVPAALAVLRRAWPPPRGPALRVPLPSVRTTQDALAASSRLIKLASVGLLAAEDAGAMQGLLEVHVRLAAVADLEGRLAALEARQDPTQP